MKKLIFVVIAMFQLLYSCEDEITPKDIIGIQLLSDSNTIPADNNSTLEFRAYISVDADDDKRDIEFETSSGVFSKNNENVLTMTAKDTIQLNNENFLSASVSLTSSNVVTDTVTITAKIASFKARSEASFTASIPNSITVSADTFGLTNTFDSEATLTAIVKSETGFPSSGEQVEFLIFNSNDHSQFTDLRFRNEKLKVNANGEASTLFTAGNLTNGASPFVGDVLVVSRVIGREAISDTLKLNVTSKID